MRVRQRKGHIKAEVAQTSACPNCGAAKRSHRACPECGYYDGEKVVVTKAEKKAEKKDAGESK